MNETILFLLIIVIAIYIIVSIYLKKDKETNEQDIIINSENLTNEQKIIFLSIIDTKKNTKTIKNISVTILLIILIPIIIRLIAFLTGAIAFDEFLNEIIRSFN